MVDKADAKAWALEAVKGLWTSPAVPFGDDGNVDHAGIKRNIDYIIGTKADGIGFGFTEPWFMSIQERLDSFKSFIDAVGGTTPCYLHAIDYSIPETIELINRAKEMGADAVMLWTPMEFAKSEEMSVEWYEHVCSQVDMAVFAYNTYHSGRSLSVEALERIAAIENVCAIKDAVNDFGHTVELLRRVGDQVAVSGSLEEYLPAATIYGKQPVLLGTTSVYFFQSEKMQPIREYMADIAAGREGDAWAKYYALKPLRDLWVESYEVLFDKQASVHPLAIIKYWMDLIGMAGGGVRAPMHPLTDASRREFKERLQATGWVEKLWGSLAE